MHLYVCIYHIQNVCLRTSRHTFKCASNFIKEILWKEVGSRKASVQVYKSLSDTERLSGLLFIKLKNLQRKIVAPSKPFCEASTSDHLSSCLKPFRFVKHIKNLKLV